MHVFRCVWRLIWSRVGSTERRNTSRIRIKKAFIEISAVRWYRDPQLSEVSKVSLARVLCDNSDLLAMQPLAFKGESAKF